MRSRIAVSEAATNVDPPRLSRVGRGPGVISVEATLTAHELLVSVTDNGRGLRAREEGPGPGLGLAMINQLADHVELLQGASGGLRVLMRFTLSTSTGA